MNVLDIIDIIDSINTITVGASIVMLIIIIIIYYYYILLLLYIILYIIIYYIIIKVLSVEVCVSIQVCHHSTLNTALKNTNTRKKNNQAMYALVC